MTGAAFGIRDVLADEPRERCEDCGTVVVWGADALGLLAALEPADRALFADWWRQGGNVYACPRCGLCGVFSAAFRA